MGIKSNNSAANYYNPFGASGYDAAGRNDLYKDPDAANLLLALSFDNNANDVQNTIRSTSDAANGTEITVSKGSAASYNSANEKFSTYTHCGYSGDDYDDGYWYCTSSNSPTWLKRLEIPFTVQFWINVVNFNEVWPTEYHGTMGNVHEPVGGRSGWTMRFGSAGTGDGLGISAYNSGDSTVQARAQFADNSMTNPMTTGTWHHIAYSIPGGGSTSRILFNGTQMTTLAVDSMGSLSDGYVCDDTVSHNTYLFGRGNEYAYDNRKDLIDAYVQDLKWYNTARSVANIQEDYNRGKAMLDFSS